MKTIKPFEDFRKESKFDDYTEVWEENDEILSGFSVWLTDEEIKELVDMNLISYSTVDKYSEPLFNEKDREKVEEYIELKRNAEKYNL